MISPKTLHRALETVTAHRGAAGVDGQTVAAVKQRAEEEVALIQRLLREGQYEPRPVQRHWIEKWGRSEKRPLGIPTIKDRVIQTAMVLVLLPIFEADMPDEQYAYRQERSAHAAVREAHRLVNGGHCQVVDVDLSGYFDSIPHAELMKSVARRICDRHMLRLIKLCLEMAVEEQGEDGRKRCHNSAKQTRRGTPQGAPLSPLLANIYMRRFIVGWKKLGWERRFNARVVNYADDMVILCRGSVSKAYRAIDAHVARQMRRWLCAKHEKRGHGTKQYPDGYLYGKLGLLRLSPLTHDLPWAKA
ncbi:MAG: hypothetical protein HY360_26195 [Verrucomicrobia bacterium]|nr:hypothetical protein [Verrucomicrobiota bacterium]